MGGTDDPLRRAVAGGLSERVEPPLEIKRGGIER